MVCNIHDKIRVFIFGQWEEIFMIKGLYESHLPVSNLEESILFYESLGLKLYKRYGSIAFFWIVEGQSWLGLWEGDEYQTKYHP